MLRPLPFLLSFGFFWMMATGRSAAEDEKNVDPLLSEAKLAFHDGRTDEALKLAGRAIEADPKSVAPRFLRGLFHETLNRHAEAIADFDGVIELDPPNAGAYDHRGSEQFRLGQIDESIADFDKAIELDPARERAHWKRGISYYYAGKFEQGRKQFEGYQTVDDNDVAVMNELFWNSPHTVRYGRAENLYGHAEIAAYRTVRKTKLDTVITTFGRDFAFAFTEARTKGSDRRGRQSHTWVRTDQGWRIVAAHVSNMEESS